MRHLGRCNDFYTGKQGRKKSVKPCGIRTRECALTASDNSDTSLTVVDTGGPEEVVVVIAAVADTCVVV